MSYNRCMTKLTFYFDPSCPFSWITSRWLLAVKAERDIAINWQPFSLALKNDELTESSSAKHADVHRASHKILRLMMAARQNDVSFIDMYSYAGRAFHVDGRSYDQQLTNEIITEFNLESSLAAAVDSADYDQELKEFITQATDVAGEDIGVPTIVFTSESGDQQGYFGPVFQELPDLKQSLQIWDGLEKLATASSFYELKRKRPDGPPDTSSTA